MALGKPKPVDFSYLSDAIGSQTQQRLQRVDKQLQTTQKKIVLTEDATRKTLDVAEKARQSSAESRKAQLDIMGSMDSTVAKAKRAIELSDSQNPLDRLELWALQQSDPSGYTREGNTERLQYLQTAAGALSNRELIVQSGYMDEVQGIQDQLTESMLSDESEVALLSAQEAAGKEAIDAAIEAQATRVQFLQNQNTMADLAISNMTPEQVKASEMAAAQTGKPVNINGIEVPQQRLTERKQALEDRDYYIRQRQVEQEGIILGNSTPEMIEQAITDAKGAKDGKAMLSGVPISLARLQERRAALLQQDYAMLAQEQGIANMAEENTNKTLTRLASTYSLPELNQLIMDGGVDKATGQQIPLPILENIRNTKSQTNQQMIAQEALGITAGDPMTGVVSQKQYFDSIKPISGSPLENAITSSKNVLTAAAALVSSGDPMRIASGLEIINRNRENVDAMITEEAKRLSSGDKKLQTAYEFQLRGQAIPQELITEALTERVTKNQGIGSWLSPANRGAFETTYRAKLAELTQTNVTGMAAADLKALAVEQAMSVVMNNVGGTMSNELMSFQFGDPTNPLAQAGMKPEQFLSLMRQADQQGARLYQQASKKSDQEMAALNSGQVSDPDYAASQASQLYLALEKTKPGLGEAYMQWWSSPARVDMAAKYVQYKTGDSKDFAQLAENSMIFPAIPNMTSVYASSLEDGQRFLYSSELQKEHVNYVTFGGDNGSKQAFLLQMDPNLSDLERQQAYGLLIQPLVVQAEANKMPPDQAAVFIETQLKTMRPTDPVAKKVLTKILQGRESALGIIDDFAYANRLRTDPLAHFMFGTPIDRALGAEPEKFKWYTDLTKGK